ncbi:MAG: chromosome partitioning protein ParB [Dolichospermum sp.]|nr:chromosome partitioning protein ParB [Dolichospermum sp.]
MMKFYTVDVKNITCDVPHSSFDNHVLDSLADMIIESGGIIRPLILKPTGLETYTVVEGNLEYYAAVRAKEKNPRQCEMVNAFVISPKNEETISQQIAALKGINTSNQIVIESQKTSINSDQSLSNQEMIVLKQQFNDLKSELAQERQERQKLYETITLIETQIAKRITPLESFNTLNLLDLVFRLRTAGFSEAKSIQVAESLDKERKKKQFESLKDVVERVKIQSGKKQQKGISAEKMVDIVDTWSKLLFL